MRIHRSVFLVVGCLATLGLGWGCSQREQTESQSVSSAAASKVDNGFHQTYSTRDTNKTLLKFVIKLNRDTYRQSDWGEPPQFAVWLEDESGQTIRTVFVTRRTGKGDWLGKVECPVSLPYWTGRYNRQNGSVGPPTAMNPLPDAMTGATPKAEEFPIFTEADRGGRWNYYIEVNCSGDYNAAFRSRDNNGMPDPQGNGQPSLVYRGQIQAFPGEFSQPSLIGRTDQWQETEELNPDLSGMTSAKDLIETMQASCLE